MRAKMESGVVEVSDSPPGVPGPLDLMVSHPPPTPSTGTRGHTHVFTLSHILTHTLMHTHIQTQAHYLAHTHTHTVSHTHTYIHAHSLRHRVRSFPEQR